MDGEPAAEEGLNDPEIQAVNRASLAEADAMARKAATKLFERFHFFWAL
jgi:hypothetical protein